MTQMKHSLLPLSNSQVIYIYIHISLCVQFLISLINYSEKHITLFYEI